MHCIAPASTSLHDPALLWEGWPKRRRVPMSDCATFRVQEGLGPIVAIGVHSSRRKWRTWMPDGMRQFMRAEITLVQASRVGDLNEVRALLSKGFDVNSRSQDGGTALVSASWTGYLDIVQELLSKGANVNLKSIDSGLAGGRTPLIAASRQGHLKVVNLLLEAGPDVHEKDGEGRDALMRASYGDYPYVVRALLSKGASPYAKDPQGYTALILARSADVTHLLIEAGAEINARTHSGNTALMYAVCGEIDLVRALLAAGAHTDIRNDDGETVLAMATNDKIRALLKRASADE